MRNTVNQMEYVVLTSLTNKEKYGAEIEEAINEGSKGMFSTNPGSLYPMLQRLEDSGMVRSSWSEKEPGKRGRAKRRVYQLTALGISTLREYDEALQGIRAWL